MPELPDLTAYIEALEERVLGRVLQRVRIANPFVLRTFDPPISDLHEKRLEGIHRIGKRISFDFEDGLHLVIHLMIAGRFRWEARGAKVPGKLGLAALDFESGTLILTEAGSKRRASMHVVRTPALAEIDRGGIEPLESDVTDFARVLRSENHTIKRALTDPRLFAGIGNAYSDEILHRAQMSPTTLTKKLSDEQIARLHSATHDVLGEWITTLRDERAGGFPEKVTAFRPQMAVHGKFRQPCPVCGAAVQRIVYADNETNYCPGCQTGGKILRDRALSRLLGDDWPG